MSHPLWLNNGVMNNAHTEIVFVLDRSGSMQAMVEPAISGFNRLLRFVKPGVGEWEVEAELAHEFIRNRSRGFAYPPIIGSGINACALHYIENKSVCEDGQLLLVSTSLCSSKWTSSSV